MTQEPRASSSLELFDRTGTRLGIFPARQTVLSDSTGVLHDVSLTGLLPSTIYSYRTAICTTPDPTLFRTAASAATRALVFGDSGADSPEQRALAARMLTRPGGHDLVLHTGDLIYGDVNEENYLRSHFALYGDLLRSRPIFPCPGNHDYSLDGARAYRALNPVELNYSFDWGAAHLAVLDSNEVSAKTLDWLETDLAANRNRATWRIVMFHHPPFAGGPNQDDPLSLDARERIVPILARQGVQLVLNGHEHNYQRSRLIDGVTYLTSGGGGAAIYDPLPRAEALVQAARHHFVELEISDVAIRGRSIAIDGALLDSFAIDAPER